MVKGHISCHVGICYKQAIPLGKNMCGKVSSQNTTSGAGERFLLQDCRAQTAIKEMCFSQTLAVPESISRSGAYAGVPHKSYLINLTNLNRSESTQCCVYLVSVYSYQLELNFIKCKYWGWGIYHMYIYIYTDTYCMYIYIYIYICIHILYTYISIYIYIYTYRERCMYIALWTLT